MKKITVIGEVLYDVYSNYKAIGGAPFNFAFHVNKLIRDVRFISAVGNDEDGKDIIDFMKKNDFDSTSVQINNYPTGKVNVSLNDEGMPSYNILTDQAYDFIDSVDIQSSDLLYVGTLAQRNSVSRNTINKHIHESSKIFFDVNLRQNFFSKEIIDETLVQATIVKLNHEELNLILDLFELPITNKIEKDAYELKILFNLEIVIVTMGKEGAIVLEKDISKSKKQVDKIIDTVGAGDAYSALFCSALLSGKTIEVCNDLAVQFAGEICKIKGAVPNSDEIYKVYRGKIQ